MLRSLRLEGRIPLTMAQPAVPAKPGSSDGGRPAILQYELQFHKVPENRILDKCKVKIHPHAIIAYGHTMSTSRSALTCGTTDVMGGKDFSALRLFSDIAHAVLVSSHAVPHVLADWDC